MVRLLEDAPRLPWASIKHHFKGIDNDITHGMLSSEQKVKPKHFKYEWLVELNQGGYHVQYWRMRYSDLKNNSPSHTALSQLFKRAGLKDGDDDVLWDLDKILERLCQARKELKEAQKKHRENRDAGLKLALEEKERKAQESEDPKATKKAAAAVEALI